MRCGELLPGLYSQDHLGWFLPCAALHVPGAWHRGCKGWECYRRTYLGSAQALGVIAWQLSYPTSHCGTGHAWPYPAMAVRVKWGKKRLEGGCRQL